MAMKRRQRNVKRAPVTKNTTLGDLVDRHPEAIPVLFSHGLHCIGCHFAATETIGQGCKAHGMDTKDVRALLKDVNAAIKEAAHRPAITLTPAAATALKDVMKATKKKGGLRVMAVEGGRAGTTYDMSIEASPNKDDEVLEHSGIKIFVDKESLRRLRGCSIDYLEHKQGFAVRRGP
jgi:iron-sulfur cluster assembly accessory protein